MRFLRLLFIFGILFCGQLSSNAQVTNDQINYYVQLNALRWDVNNRPNEFETARFRWFWRKNMAYNNETCNDDQYQTTNCFEHVFEHGIFFPVFANNKIFADSNQPATDELCFRYNAHHEFCGDNCTYDQPTAFCIDRDRHCKQDELVIKDIAGINELKSYEGNAEKSAYQFASVYRYTNGDEANKPLTFGDITDDLVKHDNSNKSRDPIDGVELGYTNTGYDSSPDVFYSFSITAPCRVSIFTANGTPINGITDYDTKIHLLNNSNQLLDTDDDGGPGVRSEIIADLCPGTYKVVVEGAGSATGNFTLTIAAGLNNFINAGSLTGVSPLCEGEGIPTIASAVDATGCSISYEWFKRTSLSSPWGDPISGATGASYDPPENMGTTTLYYRRLAKDIYGNERAASAIAITKVSASINAGAVTFVGDDFIPSGADPGSFTSASDGSATPNFTIEWQQRELNSTSGLFSNWDSASGSNNAQTYNVPALSKTTEFRRVIIGSCDNANNEQRAYSATQRIDVIEANGKITGKVRSSLLTGVAGVTVTVTRLDAVTGGTAANATKTFVTTAPNGEYTIDKLYYGPNGANFSVTPTRNDHDFSPADRTIFLDSDTPQTADFTDITVFTVTGNISQTYNMESCPVAGVKVDLKFNGTVINPLEANSTTDEFGNYSIQVDNQDQYTIEPQLTGRTFSPVVTSLFIDDDQENIDFSDITTFNIQGFVRAGCETFMGTAEVTLTAADGCFANSTITTTTDGNGFYEFTNLPAKIYNAQVTDFTPIAGYDRLTVLDFFNATKEIDLSTESQTQDFTYHAPPVIEVTGIPDPPCLAFTYPVLAQAEATNLMISIVEEGSTCPVGVGTLSINDQIGDKGAEPILLNFTNGSYEYQLVGGNPNIIFPYLKNLTITAIDTFERSDNYNAEALVTGGRPREQNFSTQSPQLPLLILRDPPGDASYSFLEQNQTNEIATRFYTADSESNNTWGNVRLGTKVNFSIFGIGTETTFWGDVGDAYQVNSTNSSATETILSITSSERFETTDSDQVTGSEGDVFVGAALAFGYAISDEVLFDEDNCEVLLDKQLVLANEGLATQFVFTEDHIRNTVIPDLEMLRDAALTDADRNDKNNQILTWQQMLQRNDDLKANADSDPDSDARWTFGGNTSRMESITATSTEVSTIEFGMEIDEEISTELGFEIAGSGISGGVIANFKMETGESETTTTVNSITTGYFLSDDDAGDQFTVDVKTDPVYKTPVFETLGGQSSCPAEPLTNARDAVQLSADNPIQAGVPAAGTATFTLRAGNISFTEETRDYMIRFKQVTNPDGAMITLGGSPYTVPQALDDIAFGTEPAVTVTVMRGTNSPVYTYEGLEFELYSDCDPEISSTIALTAFFQSPCSDITLVEPQEGFVIKQSDNNTIAVRMKDYDINSLDQVVVEFSKVGENNWTPAVVLASGDLSSSSSGTEVIWNVVNLADGAYNLRLKLVCGINTVYSSRISGLIDRTPPSILGTPEPVDDNYINGDEISIRFNELLDCSSISAANVTLRRTYFDELISVQVSCFENEIIITSAIDITAFAAEPFEVQLTSVKDVYGNSITESVDWNFNVGGDLLSLDFDSDGVPNPLDKCAGFDDAQDRDGDGIPDGCDLCADDANTGLDFDGVDDYVDLGTTLGNFGTSDYTIETWLKTSMVSIDAAPIISKRGICDCTNSFDLTIFSNGNLQWENISDDNCSDVTFLVSTLPVNDGKWHHIALVRQGDQIMMYIDGFLNVMQSGLPIIDLNNTHALQIGNSACSAAGFTDLFAGQIDEVRFWNVARSAADISAAAESEIDGTATGLLAAYRANEGEVGADNQGLTNLVDLKNTNNGTLENFARVGNASNWSTGAPVAHIDSNEDGVGDVCESALKLDWLTFTADLNKAQETDLSWIVANVTNVAFFVVEHSTDGRTWKQIGSVAATNQSSQKTYRWQHTQPASGINYYRIQEVEQDGQFSYSKVTKVYVVDASEKIQIFPNPTTGVLQIRAVELKSERVNLQLFDALGRLVQEEIINTSETHFLESMDISSLNAGIYTLQIKAGQTTEVVKVVKK
ncbi:MAG: LamG-like jellyroll fold domain-containing protein [Saprospiraceae bacterium]